MESPLTPSSPPPGGVSGSEVTGASMVMSGATLALFLSCCLAVASFPMYLNLGPLSLAGCLRSAVRATYAMLLL